MRDSDMDFDEARIPIPNRSLSSTVVMVMPMHMTGSTLISAPMPFRCSSNSIFSGDMPDAYISSTNEIDVPDNSSDTNSSSSSSKYYINNCFNQSTITHKIIFNHSNLSQHMTSMPTCPFVEYDTSIFSSTVISEHHLVCERSTLQPLFQMMHNIGGMFGSTIGGHIGDKWGRKRAVQAGGLINIMAVLGMVFVPFYPFLLLMRILTGFTIQCMLVTAWNLGEEVTGTNERALMEKLLACILFQLSEIEIQGGQCFQLPPLLVASYGMQGICGKYSFYSIPRDNTNLALESIPARHRSLVGMLLGLPYSLCLAGFAGVAYLIRTWHYLLLVCASPILMLLPLSFFVDESPRWLLVQGRFEETKKILQKAVKLNDAKLSDDLNLIIDKMIQANRSKEPEIPNQDDSCFSQIKSSLHQCWVYLNSPGMRIILIATAVLWFLQGGLYLAVAINANNFTSSNPFLYVALSGLMDGLAVLLFTPITPFFGRRIIVGFGLFAGGVLFLLELLVSTDYYWVKWVLVMAGFFLVAGSFQVNFLYAPELFPTEARTRGFAFVNMVGSFGFVCAPFVTDILGSYNKWAASVTFGCSGILASFMVAFLPETNNKPLPDTIQDIEIRRKAAKIKPRKTGVDNQGYEQGESVL